MIEYKTKMGRQTVKFLLLTFFIIGFILASNGLIWGQYVPPPYGEVAPSGQILIDKKIKDPVSENYVDNLGVNDYRFAPGEEVVFKIFVQNAGTITFEKVTTKDTLPPYVELVSGSTEIEYQNLKPDEAREFEIQVKIVPADKLPNDKGLYCVINKVEVIADDQTDEDTTQLCLEKKVLGVAIQPEAGANILLLSLGFLGISALGLILKKKFAL